MNTLGKKSRRDLNCKSMKRRNNQYSQLLLLSLTGSMLRVTFFSQRSLPMKLFDKLIERRLEKCEIAGMAFIPMPVI